MLKIFTIIVSLIVFSSSVFAHEIYGYKPERTKAVLGKVEAFYENEYGLVLDFPVKIYVTKTFGEYTNFLQEKGVTNAKDFARSAYAVTSKNHGIVVDSSALSDAHFAFILAHELTHQYQFRYNKNFNEDYVLLEGHADLMANKITKYPIRIKDHGIRYEEVKAREKFLKECHINRDEAVEQVRYYAQYIKFETTLPEHHT